MNPDEAPLLYRLLRVRVAGAMRALGYYLIVARIRREAEIADWSATTVRLDTIADGLETIAARVAFVAEQHRQAVERHSDISLTR